MAIINDKRAMALPFVLGIVTFVVGIIATLISYAVFQSRLITKNIESTESYQNAVQSINATIHVIIRDNNLSASYLSNLANYMQVSITPISDNVWMISRNSSDNITVKSFISGNMNSISVVDEQFIFTGLESGWTQNEFITPLKLISTYVPDFLITNFPNLTPENDFTSFTQLFSYIDSLSEFTNIPSYSVPNPINGHYYVDGNYNLGNNTTLTIPDGYLLFIHGDLIMNRNSTLIGNVVVSGNLITYGHKNFIITIQGTVYTGGNIVLNERISVGSVNNPAFLISNGSITTGTQITGTGYLFAYSSINTSSLTNLNLIGGMYPKSIIPSSRLSINAFTNISTLDLYFYAIPELLYPPSEDTQFKYTYPR